MKPLYKLTLDYVYNIKSFSKRVKKITAEDGLKPICIKDFYDHALSGLAEYNNNIYYYKIYINDHCSYRRKNCRYFLISLTEEQQEYFLYWKDQFNKYVGNHWDLGPDWKRISFPTVNNDESMKNSYYEKVNSESFKSERTEMMKSIEKENEIIGYFFWGGK